MSTDPADIRLRVEHLRLEGLAIANILEAVAASSATVHPSTLRWLGEQSSGIWSAVMDQLDGLPVMPEAAQ